MAAGRPSRALAPRPTSAIMGRDAGRGGLGPACAGRIPRVRGNKEGEDVGKRAGGKRTTATVGAYPLQRPAPHRNLYGP